MKATPPLLRAIRFPSKGRPGTTGTAVLQQHKCLHRQSHTSNRQTRNTTINIRIPKPAQITQSTLAQMEGSCCGRIITQSPQRRHIHSRIQSNGESFTQHRISSFKGHAAYSAQCDVSGQARVHYEWCVAYSLICGIKFFYLLSRCISWRNAALEWLTQVVLHGIAAASC